MLQIHGTWSFPIPYESRRPLNFSTVQIWPTVPCPSHQPNFPKSPSYNGYAENDFFHFYFFNIYSYSSKLKSLQEDRSDRNTKEELKKPPKTNDSNQKSKKKKKMEP